MDANQRKHEQVENIIRRSKTLILNVKLLGADTSHAKELLDNAKSALDQGDYNTAIDFAKKSMVEVISLKKQVQAGEISKPPLLQKDVVPEQVNSKGDDVEVEVNEPKDKLESNSENRTQNDYEKNQETNSEMQYTSQTESDQITQTQKTTAPALNKGTITTPASGAAEITSATSGVDKLTPEVINKFEESFSYLVEENRANNCFKIFSNFVAKGLNGLCICRINPNIIKRKYQIMDERGTVLWLTDRESSKEATISPSLESMIYVAEEFIDKNDNGILLLDGLEYLISNNSFNPVLRFIRRLIDKISETTSILIIGVSPKAINEQELKLLERELNPIIL